MEDGGPQAQDPHPARLVRGAGGLGCLVLLGESLLLLIPSRTPSPPSSPAEVDEGEERGGWEEDEEERPSGHLLVVLE